jgi:uncharacterized repeat protein (TIGR03809 family)
MPEQIPRCMPVALTQRWRALAERRRAHFIELYDTGRWKHYYTEEQLLIRMREAIQLSETWEQLCVPPRERKREPLSGGNGGYAGIPTAIAAE